MGAHQTGKAAFDRGLVGDFGPAHTLLESEPASDFTLALKSQLAFAGDSKWPLPSPKDVQTLTSAPLAKGLVCAVGVRHAFLSFDANSLQEWERQHESCSGLDQEGTLWQEATRALSHLSSGRAAQALSVSHALEAQAATLTVAPLVIDAASIRAHALLALGRLDEATQVARRATRMARTEELPAPQYFANLALARIRRYQNRPHLAVRILVALARKAPPVWTPLLRWELMLAGGPAATSAVPEGQAPDPAAVVERALVEGASGNRQALERGLAAGKSQLRGMAPFLDDLIALRAAADPESDLEHASANLRAWSLGEGDLPGDGLTGAAAGFSQTQTLAVVAVRPDSGARRIFSVGSALCGPLLTRKRPGRAETSMAVLALAGPQGMDRDSFFRAVYGFEFVAGIHQANLDSVLYRVRGLLAGFAELIRDSDGIRLSVQRSFTVPDARCARPLEDELLRSVAQGGRRSAKEVAQSLGVPLRTVQLMLKGLVEDGSCLAKREGRSVSYCVEDTTFQEPTRTGVGAL